jgi:DNA (cytosine-5)-methyltransferase 1
MKLNKEGITNTLTSVQKDNYLVEAPKIEMIGMLDMKGNETVRRVYDPEGLAPTLTTSEGGHRQPKIMVAGSLKPDHCTRIGQRDVVWDAEGIAGTLNATDYKQPRPILHQYRVRKLTPREYARLQGFPDTYEQVVSNSQFYKQMGNAVSVPVAYAIAKAIKEQL